LQHEKKKVSFDVPLMGKIFKLPFSGLPELIVIRQIPSSGEISPGLIQGFNPLEREWIDHSRGFGYKMFSTVPFKL
jgi:hypothetical protein